MGIMPAGHANKFFWIVKLSQKADTVRQMRGEFRDTVKYRVYFDWCSVLV